MNAAHPSPAPHPRSTQGVVSSATPRAHGHHLHRLVAVNLAAVRFRSRAALLGWVLCLVLNGGTAMAQSPSAPAIASASMLNRPESRSDIDPIEQAVRILVERETPKGHRIELQVGKLDTRVQLAPCARAEPFVPPGGRLWGRSMVGIRCTAGASWAVRLPVHVQVFAPVLIANASLPAGANLNESDFRLEEYELTRESAPLANDPAALVGRQLTRAITAGQALRIDMLRIPPTIQAGEPLPIILTGQGFSLSSEGVALTPGSEGQTLRVRTESGRVVSGILRNRTLEMRL